jgi:hypothetical protein
MAQKRREAPRPLATMLTANQVVALKVEEARWAKRWTQAETVRQLRRVGLRWSRAAYAMAVGSPKTQRAARFDADQLVAFARVFGVPAWTFLIPPVAWNGRAIKVRMPHQQDSKALDDAAMFDVARGPLIEEPRSEEERRQREREEARMVERLFEIMYKHRLLPKPEPLPEFAPEVQADLGKAFARVLKKHGIAPKEIDWPRISPYQIEALVQALKPEKEK